jgi:TrmH family RNA methyltransferase
VTAPLVITSRDNPRLARVRRLLRDPGAYRRCGVLWLEGDHLLRACLQRGVALPEVLIGESAWQRSELRSLALQAGRIGLLSDSVARAAEPLTASESE